MLAFYLNQYKHHAYQRLQINMRYELADGAQLKE